MLFLRRILLIHHVVRAQFTSVCEHFHVSRLRSKLDQELVVKAIQNILKFSAGETINVDGEEKKGKQRKFLETVELQISKLALIMAAAAALGVASSFARKQALRGPDACDIIDLCYCNRLLLFFTCFVQRSVC